MNRIELLSPAGSIESFYAAIQNGADAIYLGGKLFNARSRASNFSIDEINYVVRYAHVRGVKIYVTVNILISDKEFERALDFLRELYLADVDGVIIQDIGLACAAKSVLPGLNMHASTQMTVYNRCGVEFLKNLGFKRVVLARETSLKEMEKLKDDDIEIEMFGHGALCISYSGQCLFSSMVGGRSGNRGNCAGPCRLVYELIEKNAENMKCIKKGYLISPKDFSSINNIDKFIKSGVTSLKIEGRIKTPEYVGIVTRLYRKYIDNAYIDVSSYDLKDLKQIFNRGGFTKGYIDGFVPDDMITTEKPKNWGLFLGNVLAYKKNFIKIRLKESISVGDGIEVWNNEDDSPGGIVSNIMLNNKMIKKANAGDVVELGLVRGKINVGHKVYKTSDKNLNQSVRIDKEMKRVGLKAFCSVRLNEKLFIKISDDDGNVVKKYADVVGELAVNKPLSKERVICQLEKTGNTPFYFMEIDVDMDSCVTVPISEINNIRRLALEKLEKIRETGEARYVPKNYENDKKRFLERCRGNERPDNISIFFYDVGSYADKPFWELDVLRIYLPLFFVNNINYKDILNKCRSNGIEVCLWTPFVTRVKYDLYIEKNIDNIRDFDGVLCGNVGTMEYFINKGVRVLCDYSFNVFNSNTARYLKDKGVELVTLSNELTLKQINNFDNLCGVQKEILVYGNLQVMTSEYCIVGDVCGKYKNGKCNGCHKNCDYYLKDRMGKFFKIRCDSYTHRMTIFNSSILFFGDNVSKLRGVDTIRLNILDEDWDEVKKLVKLHKYMLQEVHSEPREIENKGYTRGHLYREV